MQLQSETIANLAADLIQARTQFKPLTKGKTVKTGSYSYSYADLEAVNASVEEALSANGLVIIQQTDYIDGKDVLVTTLAHESGEFVRGVLSLPVRKEADHQERGSAITYTRRYAISAILNLTADEDDDGALTTRKSAPKAPQKPQRKARKPQEKDVQESFEVERNMEASEVDALIEAVQRELGKKNNVVDFAKTVVKDRDWKQLAELTTAEGRAVVVAARRKARAEAKEAE